MRKCKLSECVKEINDRTIENNQYEVLTSSKNGIFSQEEYFDKQVASKDNTGYKIIKNGQFTYRSMSDSGTFTINRLEDKNIGIVSPAYPVFEATNVDAEFLKYYFKSELFNKAIINLSQGSTRTALKYKDLIDIEIYLPEIEEQKRIVKILKNSDQIIEKYDELIKEKEQFIKSQFVEMFGNPNGNNKELEIVKLKDICENLDNQRIPVTSTNRTSGKYPYYGASGIVDYVNDYIFDEDLLLVSEDGANLIARVTPIAFSITGKAWVNNHAHVLRFKNKCTQIYVENFFENLNINQYITGITQPKLNQERLNSIEIPIPDIESQEKYMGIKKLIDKQKFNYINKVKLLKEIINIFLGGKKI